MMIDSIDPRTWSTTAQEIKKWRPDSVLMASWHPFVSPCLGSIARKMDVQVVNIVHNVTPHGAGKSLVKYQMDGCDRNIVLNKNEDLPNAEYIPFPPYSHFGEPIEKDRAKETFGVVGKKVLLFFGCIKRYKGLDILLEAMKYLDDSYALIIAGESYSGWAKYKKLIAGVKQKVIVNNYYIPFDSVRWYFSVADVCVLPYRSATQSAVGAVAEHYGTPCIATPAVKDSAVRVSDDYSPKSIAVAIERHFEYGSPTEPTQSITWEQFAKRLYP
jgi:glycosyltransferase involved in cell wall biosynthesis